MVFIYKCKNDGGLKRVITCDKKCKCQGNVSEIDKLLNKHNKYINKLESLKELFDVTDNDFIYQNIKSYLPQKITKKDIQIIFIPCDCCDDCVNYFKTIKK